MTTKETDEYCITLVMFSARKKEFQSYNASEDAMGYIAKRCLIKEQIENATDWNTEETTVL